MSQLRVDCFASRTMSSVSSVLSTLVDVVCNVRNVRSNAAFKLSSMVEKEPYCKVKVCVMLYGALR